MKISSNMDVSSKKYGIDKVKENENIAAAEQKNKVTDREEIGASLQRKDKNIGVRSEEELDSIINDIVATTPPVDNADEMIRKANESILNNSDDAVLAQANSTSERVAELLN